jgi:very-short-patch-repair endonuclease
MKTNIILPYNPKLKILARRLRNNSTLAEVLLWQNIKGKSYGYEFHRQLPIDEFIVDFYCHELHLAIEIDGDTHNYIFENDINRQNKHPPCPFKGGIYGMVLLYFPIFTPIIQIF